MSNFKHYIDGIKNGESFFNEEFKLNVILNALCVVHAVYAILFFVFDMRYLGFYAVVTEEGIPDHNSKLHYRGLDFCGFA